MKTSTLTITMSVALLACGCDLLTPADSCKPGNLYDSLTAEQQGNCSECGDAYECDSETGEDEPVGALSCIGDISDSVEEFCVVGDPLPGNFEAWHSKDISECHTPTSPVECVRSWSDPDGEADRECVLCEANIMAFDLDVMHPTHAGDWPMCMTDDSLLGTYHKYRPMYDWDGYAPPEPYDNWFAITGCSLDSDTYAGRCEPVLMTTRDQSGPKDGFITGQWTCACDVDADCQTGAVCESGWVINGGVPEPTLCTWDDGSGTSNGIAPEGPVVYGLDAWEDGIIVDGDAITMTPSMYIGLIPGALNDDQSFGMLGDLTHVGPDSLAAHIGLEVGDMFDVDPQRTIDALALGEVVDITVMHADGSERDLTVMLKR